MPARGHGWRRLAPVVLILLGAEGLALLAHALMRPPGAAAELVTGALVAALLAGPLIWLVVSRQMARAWDMERLRADARTASILTASIDGIITTTADGIVTRFNGGAERIFGYAADEVIGRHIRFLIPADPREASARETDSGGVVTRTPSGAVGNVEGVRKNGGRFAAGVSVSSFDIDGDKTLTVIVRDTTVRRQMESELRATRDRLTTLLENLAVAAWTLDGEGRVTMAEGRVVDSFGVPQSDLIGRPLVDLYGTRRLTDDSSATLTAGDVVARALAGNTVVVRGRVRGFWLESHVGPLRADDGTVTGVIGVSVDISARVAAEDARKKSDALVASVFESAPLGIAVIDEAHGTFITVNRQYERLAGRSAADLIGQDYLLPEHPDHRARTMELQELMVRHEIPGFQVDKRWVRPGGDTVWVRLTATRVVIGEPGSAVHIQMVDDVTERRRTRGALEAARDRLRRLSRRLLTIQEAERRAIASEMHDELGQALSAAKISLDSLQRFPDPSSARERIRGAADMVARALSQVRSLSLALRPALLDDLGAAAAIRWLVEEHRQLGQLEIEFRGPDDRTRFDADVEIACFRIAQAALTNVVRHANARRAIISLDVAGDAVTLSVRDDGTGFDVAAAHERADAGESLGVLGIDERAYIAGGEIEWTSAPGQGTEVRVRFPVTKRGSGARVPTPANR